MVLAELDIKDFDNYIYVGGASNYYFEEPEIDDRGERYTKNVDGIEIIAMRYYEKKNSADPFSINTYKSPIYPMIIKANMNLLYVFGADEERLTGNLTIVDFRKPHEPQVVGGCDFKYGPVGVEIIGNLAYVSDFFNQFYVIELPKLKTGFETVWKRVSADDPHHPHFQCLVAPPYRPTLWRVPVTGKYTHNTKTLRYFSDISSKNR